MRAVLPVVFLFLVICLDTACSVRVVLYMANVGSEASNRDLLRSLQAIRGVFLSYRRTYPIFIAYDRKLERHVTSGLVREIEAETGNCTHGKAEEDEPCMRLIPVRKWRHVPWPFSMYTDLYRGESEYYSSIGYRLMCRFWGLNVFNQSFMSNVTSYMKLDTDTFVESMQVDPFEVMERDHLDYLGSVMYKEPNSVVDGLWETFLRFASEEGIHPGGLTRLSNENVDSFSEEDISRMPVNLAVDVLFRRGYNLVCYYNNWEVSRMRVWTSPVFARLARFIDAAGGIILRRWGDAPIRTLAVHLLQNELDASFRQYRGLVLYHKALHSTPGTELV
jgi:hypothetical protein